MPNKTIKHKSNRRRQRGGFFQSIKNYINSRANALYNMPSSLRLYRTGVNAPNENPANYDPTNPKKSALAKSQKSFQPEVEEHNARKCLTDANKVTEMINKQKSCKSWFNFTASNDPQCKELKQLVDPLKVCEGNAYKVPISEDNTSSSRDSSFYGDNSISEYREPSFSSPGENEDNVPKNPAVQSGGKRRKKTRKNKRKSVRRSRHRHH